MKNIAQHILDITQNAIRAKANIVEIYIHHSEKENLLELIIKDNGEGMNQDMVDRVTDPYTTTRNTRKVGMGIPLLKQNAEAAGGSFAISSAEKQGTMVQASFQLDHLDRPPLGDLTDTITSLAAGNADTDFIITFITDQGEYIFNTREVKEVLDDTPIYDSQVVKYLKEMLAENIEAQCSLKVS